MTEKGAEEQVLAMDRLHRKGGRQRSSVCHASMYDAGIWRALGLCLIV